MTLPPIIAVDRPRPNEVAVALVLPREAPCFAGHFPGQPILPGVVQIDWAMRLAAEYLGISEAVATDFQVKFRVVMRPGDNPICTLRLEPDSRRLSFEYAVGGAIASSGRVKLG
jgi:3-hydroxyacyl-[acyl-carrier-protein] dehydratase